MNRICIQRTRFTNLSLGLLSEGKLCLPDGETEDSFGFRAYDDEDQVYSNIFTLEQVMQPDEKFLLMISNNGDAILTDMLDFALEQGLEIDDEWYDAKWVQKVLTTS